VPNIARVRIALTGWTGGPGVITEHYSQGSLLAWDTDAIQDLVDEVAARYAAESAVFIDQLTATVEPAVSIIDVESGNLVDIITATTPPAAAEGSGSGQSLSRATQLCIRLLTSDFRNGRRVQGRLFWGPIQSGIITAGGTIDSAVGASVAAGFAASISGLGPRLCVYSRPNPALSRVGAYADVTTVGYMPRPAVLRSRRD
jgi:hypothetical protein